MSPAVGQLWYSYGRLFRVDSLLIDADFDRIELVEVARDALTTDQERGVIARRLESSQQLAAQLAQFDADRSHTVESQWFALADRWPDRGRWAGSAEEWIASRSARGQKVVR